MATRANFIIDQGSTFTTTIDIDNNGTIFELSDSYQARGKIRKSYDSSSSVDFTCVVSDNSPKQDVVTISLTNAQTLAMTPGNYVYDVEIYQSPGSVTRLIEGETIITPSVTQSTGTGGGIGVDSPSS
tara:strand:- start:1237 stop:1620 length:384 start_codon:yes stop_codon:yes gene_type:complete